MSKADSSRSMPASGLNRRGLLAAGVAVAAAASVPALAAPEPFSAEFLTYRRCHAARLALYHGDYVENAAWCALERQRSNAIWDAIRAVAAQPVRSWQDVVERAHIFRDQLFHLEDGVYQQDSINDELDCMLMDAIFTMAQGGEHV